MVLRRASAVWQGTLQEGNGSVSTERGLLDKAPYNFSGRFGDGTLGTNPEELIAAAHASCFSMASSSELGKRDITPDAVATEASLRFEKTDAGMSITGIHLDCTVTAPGADAEVVGEALAAAKAGCPISRLLAHIEITLDVHLA